MEFEEMKKIWDSQNNETLYVVNEEVMHNAVRSKKNKANRLVNIDEIGLILINLIVGTIQLVEGIFEKNDPGDYVMGILMYLVAAYVFYLRTKRLKEERRFDRTILGEIDHAISSTLANIRLGTGMMWWFMLPVALVVGFEFFREGIVWYKWLLMAGVFSLAYFVTRLGVNKQHRPRLEKLISLKAKLIEEVN